MPFPIVIGGIVLGVSAITGAYNSYRGGTRMKEAKRIGSLAQERCQRAIRNLESKRAATLERATDYGEFIERCHGTTVQRLAEFLVALQKRPGMQAIPLPDDVEVSASTLEQYRAQYVDAPKDLLGAASALTAGVAAGASTLGMVGLFGTASTGAAIAGLSGAAATNATMAWLGGGSLAAGGFGMAGGAVVLGGIAVAPVLLVTGFVLAGKSERMLTKAHAYEAKVNSQIAKSRQLRRVLGQIDVRLDEMKAVLAALNQRAKDAVSVLDPSTFSKESPTDMKNLTIALQMVRAMTEVMRTPIVVEGELSQESGRVVLKYRSTGEE